MSVQVLLLAVATAYVVIRLRIGILKVRAQRERDFDRVQRLGAIGFQMMFGGLILMLVIGIAALLLGT